MTRHADPRPDWDRRVRTPCKVCGYAAINVRHDTPERRAEYFADTTLMQDGGTFGDYWREYYADIPYHPFE